MHDIYMSAMHEQLKYALIADAFRHVPATVLGAEATTHPSVAGYRDDSLETVKRNEQQYQIPLEVVSYKQLYGWTMDEIVKEIGTKNNCTFCGVFRRQALDRGAAMMKVHTSAPVAALHTLVLKFQAETVRLAV